MKNKKMIVNCCLVSIILAIFSVGLFYKTLFLGDIFAWYNDQLFQHNVFYKEWHEIIREILNNKVLAVYSWNTFLGTDYLASKLMYCVGDFLITPFFFLHSGSINYDVLFAITTIICIVLSGINMFLYLEKIGIKKDWLLLSLPIVYALGGFAMTYTGSYMFHRFYALLPLLFFFCERYIQDSKRIGFSIIAAILFMQSYELLFSTCFFLVLYFVVSNKLQFEESIKDILRKSLPLILSFVIGILLCGFALVPLFLFIKGNPRVATYSFDGIIWDFRTIVGIITNIFVPSFNYRSDMPAYMFYTGNHYSGEYGFFITSIIILAFLLLSKKGSTKEKRTLFTGELIILLCLLIKPLNSIIHGFSIPSLRWIFLLEIYHIMVVAYVFNKYNYDFDNKKNITIVYSLYVLLYLSFVLFYKINIKEYWISIVINTTCLLLVYVYDYLLKKSFDKLLTIMVIVNIMAMYVTTISSTYYEYGKGEETYNNEYLQFFIDNDGDLMERYFFKSEELWPYSWLNLNDSINNNYMGVTTYDSTYDSKIDSFLQENGFDSWMIDMNNPKLQKMLGVKYIVTSNDELLVNDNNYQYITNLNNFKIYQFEDYNHIAYTISNFVKESESQNVDWGNELVIKDEDYDKVSSLNKIEKAQLFVTEYSRQYLKGNIESKGNAVLFVATPYSTGWNIYDQDGRQLETINVNKGFLGVIIDEKVNELTFYYGTPGLKLGIAMSGVGFIGLIIMIIFDKKH